MGGGGGGTALVSSTLCLIFSQIAQSSGSLQMSLFYSVIISLLIGIRF